MKIFELKDPKALGERDETYGTTYASEIEGADYYVIFNSKMDYIPMGSRITAEEYTEKTDKKGRNYLRLKKVKVETPAGSQGGGAVEPTPTVPYATNEGKSHPASSEIMSKLDRIERKIDSLLTGEPVEETEKPSGLPFN